jgi:Ca2+-binding RTX toxin-like protein
MTTVTITIDDPAGRDSNLLFPSLAPYRINGGGGAGDGTLGFVDFLRLANGVPDSTTYQVRATGTGIRSTSASLLDFGGNIDAIAFRVAPDSVTFTQVAHMDFGGGSVPIPSLLMLTPDTLMGIVAQNGPATPTLVLVGNNGNDTLTGSLYDDVLRGSAGADRVDGRDGIDTASYEFSSAAVTVNLTTGVNSGADAQGDHLVGIENILGSSWNDRLTGDAGANGIDGGLGFDTIDGGDGDDAIFGRDGGGLLHGGAGNDRVDGGAQNDTIWGGIGNDDLRVGLGINTAYGEDGNDTLRGDTGIDRLYGGAGNDRLDGGSGNDILDGGTGVDTLLGGPGATRYYVDNVLDQVIDLGMNDADQVYTAVSFVLTAGSLIERFSATNAAGTGAINLTGNEFNQLIYGNAGANTIDGKGGADTMTGYGGNDRYFVDNALDKAIEATGGGTDQVLAAVSWTLTANSAIETLSTTNAAGVGAIALTGNSLAQSIQGNNGANVLDGKAGADTLRGFGGADTFAFTTALGTTNIDTVADFNVATDTIRLENAVFTGLAGGVLAAAAFFKGSAAHDADDRVIYNAATGALLFDKDGLGGAAAVRFATVSTGLAMTNADFSVV